MIHYDEYNLRLIENEIIRMSKYSKLENELRLLLKLRKDMLDSQALEHQKELLPDIIAFNEALRNALKVMYDKANNLYQQFSVVEQDIDLEAQCFLEYNYPKLHPYQADDRQDLWEALCDYGDSSIKDGIPSSLHIRDGGYRKGIACEPFEEFIGMDCGNWNEGLDRELTKDLHLINAFYYLFGCGCSTYALTDIIFVRNFNMEFILTNNKSILLQK